MILISVLIEKSKLACYNAPTIGFYNHKDFFFSQLATGKLTATHFLLLAVDECLDNKTAEDRATLYFYIGISHFLFSSTDNEAVNSVWDTAALDFSTLAAQFLPAGVIESKNLQAIEVDRHADASR